MPSDLDVTTVLILEERALACISAPAPGSQYYCG